MRIGELSRATGVAPSRIRFYERHGLLPPADRRSNGYRDYPGGAVQSLLFIQQAQGLGFSLKEIGSVLPSAYGPRADCTQIIRSLREKLVQLDEHLVRTMEAKAGIVSMIAQLERRSSHGEQLGKCLSGVDDVLSIVCRKWAFSDRIGTGRKVPIIDRRCRSERMYERLQQMTAIHDLNVGVVGGAGLVLSSSGASELMSLRLDCAALWLSHQGPNHTSATHTKCGNVRGIGSRDL